MGDHSLECSLGGLCTENALDSCWLSSLVKMRGSNWKVSFRTADERQNQNPNPNVARTVGLELPVRLLVNQTTSVQYIASGSLAANILTTISTCQAFRGRGNVGKYAFYMSLQGEGF